MYSKSFYSLAKQSNLDAFVPKALSRKKVVAKQRRNSHVYKRIAYLSVTFYEKGAATEHTKNDHLKSGHFDCSVVCCDVGAGAGFEPTVRLRCPAIRRYLGSLADRGTTLRPHCICHRQRSGSVPPSYELFSPVFTHFNKSPQTRIIPRFADFTFRKIL